MVFDVFREPLNHVAVIGCVQLSNFTLSFEHMLNKVFAIVVDHPDRVSLSCCAVLHSPIVTGFALRVYVLNFQRPVARFALWDEVTAVHFFVVLSDAARYAIDITVIVCR